MLPHGRTVGACLGPSLPSWSCFDAGDSLLSGLAGPVKPCPLYTLCEINYNAQLLAAECGVDDYDVGMGLSERRGAPKAKTAWKKQLILFGI